MNSVVLVGPASPHDLAEVFTGDDRRAASQFNGYRGLPVSELARELARAGMTVEVVSSATQITEEVAFEGDRVKMVVVPARPRARARALDMFRQERRQLAEVIRKASGDVVHAHWTYEFAWAARSAKRSLVVTAHDAPLTILRHHRDPYRAVRTLMAYFVRLRLASLITVSPYLAVRWRKEMLFRGHIDIIPNLIALPDLAVREENRVGLLCIANDSRLKNVKTLLRAFARVGPGLDVDLKLIGQGLGQSDPLRSWAAENGVVERVQFLGPLGRSALAKQLAGAALMVHPSLEESCPGVVLEAMASGLPVLGGASSGGVPWLLDEGRAGLLVDVRDADALSAGIVEALADVELRAKLGQAAKDRATTYFSRSRVLDLQIEAYERAG